MTKRKIALLLALVLIFNNISIFANTQLRIPQDGLDYVTVSNGSSGSEGDIYPKAKISFKTVDNSSNTSPDGDYTSSDNTTLYWINLVDSFGNAVPSKTVPANTLNVVGGKATVDLEKVFTASELKNGTLYKLTVQPGHTHPDPNPPHEPHNANLDRVTTDPVRYFITDLNTTAREKDGEIEVVWEYIPNAIYKLTYIDMDCTTKDEVDGIGLTNYSGVGSKTVPLKASELDSFTENGVKKVKYILENTLPGQRYSAYAYVDGMENNSFLTTPEWDSVGVNKTTPKITKATKSIGLNVSNIGNNRIRISWGLRSWMNGRITAIKIYRRGEGETTKSLIGTIYNNGSTVSDSGTYEHDEPTKNSYYQVEFVVKKDVGGETSVFTDEALYIPYALREKPLKPQVPLPFTSLSDVVPGKEADYLVKDDNIQSEQMEKNTFHVVRKTPLNIQLVWDAPTKKDTNGNDVVDYDIKYDIWVSDQALSSIDTSDMEPTISDYQVSKSSDDRTIKAQDATTVVGFKTILDKYINSKSVSKEDLSSNKTYYIRIVAKKDYDSVVVSSIPTLVTITVDKNGDIYRPPVLSKPPLKVKENADIDKQHNAAIEWKEKWYEIKADDPSRYSGKSETEQFFAKLWNSSVYTDNSGASPIIRFEGGNGLTEHHLLTQNDLRNVKSKDPNYSSSYSDREVTLGSDVKYEIKTVLYNDVVSKIKENIVTTSDNLKISKWVIENESDTTDGWNDITPNRPTSSDWIDYTVEGLKPNTKYIIMVRVYRTLEDGTKLKQTYPSYVIVTTDTDFGSPEADPTVPILNANGVTDTSVSVWWTYNKEFTYEIMYGRVDDVSKAKSWPVEISDVVGEKNYVADRGKAIAIITGLFPESEYYVWIRVKQKIGDKASAWSNSLLQRTSSIGIPDPPHGLGTATYQTILGLGLDFQPVASEYITVEWLKDVNDLDSAEDEIRKYSYVVEFANNSKFQDALTFDVSADNTGDNTGYKYTVLDKTTVRFNGLEANKKYYVRVKTVLTVKIDDREIVKESEFTSTVGIKTKTSNDEYDGGENPNVVEYEKPIVQTYNNDIWTYELVDAAKITTQILQEKAYYYTVTMENYKNKYDAITRRVKMPTKIIETISNQGMVLRIATNIGTYDIPGQALRSYMAAYEGTDLLQIDLTRKSFSDISLYGRTYPEQYQGGEVLEIALKGKTKNTKVNTLDTDMTVKLKTDVTGAYNYSNYTPYQYNYNTGSWASYPYQVDNVDNKFLNYTTRYTGLNALYVKTVANSTESSSYLMNALASAYNISGLGTSFAANSPVKASQYVKLMVGLAQKSGNIDLVSGATSEDYQKARAAGFFTSNTNGNVTKEQALAGVVKLYEIKHGNKIKPSNMTFSGVSPAYAEAISKAYAVGLIEMMNSPQGNVTYSELCDWIALAVE